MAFLNKHQQTKESLKLRVSSVRLSEPVHLFHPRFCAKWTVACTEISEYWRCKSV